MQFPSYASPTPLLFSAAQTDPLRSLVQDHGQLRDQVEFVDRFNQSLAAVINSELLPSLETFAKAMERIHKLVDTFVHEHERLEKHQLQTRRQQFSPKTEPSPLTSQGAPPLVDQWCASSPDFCGGVGGNATDCEVRIIADHLLPNLANMAATLSAQAVPAFVENVRRDCLSWITEPAAESAISKPTSNSRILSYDFCCRTAQHHQVGNPLPSNGGGGGTVLGTAVFPSQLSPEVASVCKALAKDNAHMRHQLNRWAYDTPTVFAHLLLHTTDLVETVHRAFGKINTTNHSTPNF